MKNIRIYTETVIDSSHKLIDYEGKCKNLHGHTWKISLWVEGSEEYINDIGILFDFGILKQIIKKFDHTFLNDLKEFKNVNPTAENISRIIYEKLRMVKPFLKFCVRVYETSIGKTTWAEYGDFHI